MPDNKGGKDQKGGKGGKKSKKPKYRKCLGICYAKKVIPPDYDNIDNEEDWQMSPFSKERFDLDEIQRLEKKGMKGKQELEALKRKLAGITDDDADDACGSSAEMTREKPKRQSGATPSPAPTPPPPRINCTTEVMYQPYGPLFVPARSYSRPPNARQHSVYCYLGPSYSTGYHFNVPSLGMGSELGPPMSSNFGDFSNFSASYGGSYIPLGP